MQKTLKYKKIAMCVLCKRARTVYVFELITFLN